MKKATFKIVILGVIILLVVSVSAASFVFLNKKTTTSEKPQKVRDLSALGIKLISIEYNFSEPIINEVESYSYVYVDEADFYSISTGRPVVPVKLSTYEFPLGTKIIDVNYEYSKPETMILPKTLSFGACSTSAIEDETIYKGSEMYPSSIVSYHTGGGLSDGEHKTFLTVRVYPITYNPLKNEIGFIQNVKVNINYKEPEKPLLDDKNEYELLIITPSEFERALQPLVKHKNKFGVTIKLVTLKEIYDKESNGRDEQEKIKYFIKNEIETSGIKYVLLVGGIKGQTSKWNMPVRYSHVLISPGKQEIPEPAFLSDLYYADIYDGEGNFSSWDTNNNNIFAEWTQDQTDKMDLYPDVYLGRLACRNKFEVKTMVNKIINYEKNKADESWFKKIIMVSGDHWKDPDHINEGALMMEEASKIMSDFTPVKLITTEKNKILVRNVNKALNSGAGFAYFCGHGSPTAWGIHYPPDASGWAPTLTKSKLISFYYPAYMNFLRNKNKLPITIVGGCNNAQFDISMAKTLKAGKIPMTTNCWAWKLTCKRGGGSIATIANTGLGTHAMSDSDKNSVNDYLEILDGWMELRFLELYGQEHRDVLGENHGQTITEYLHRFFGNNDEMDTKMVQQWQLFGDPSLKIGGYS